MTNQCIRIENKGIYSGDIVFENFFCGVSVETPPSYEDNGFQTVGIVVMADDGSVVSSNPHAAQAGSVSWNFVANSNTRNPTYSYGDCNSCSSIFYDFVNSSCVPSTTYGTPGSYPSLATCNAAISSLCPICPSAGGVCPPCPAAPASAGSCPSGQSCQLSTGEDVNFVNISAPIFLGTCDPSGAPVIGTRSVSVIQGTDQSELLKFQELAQIQGAAVCQVDVAAIPDGWLIRPEWHRSQAVYQFAQIDTSGNIIGAPKYKITVPHHIATKPTSGLPNYQRGNWETIFVLNDNSKVTIHSLDAANGNLMLNAIKLLIDPTQLTNAYLSKSCLVVTDTDIAQITVKNRMAKYWSEGTKNELPDWVEKW